MRARLAALGSALALAAALLGAPVSAAPLGPQPARGSIVNVPAAALLDGDTFSLSDGVSGPAVFEFDKSGGVAPGRLAISLSVGDSAATVKQRVVTAINASGLAVTAADGGGSVVTLLNQAVGTFGNQAILENVGAPGFLVDGMSGGTDADTQTSAAPASGRIYAVAGTSLVDGEGLVIPDGQGFAVLEFDSDGTVSAGSIRVQFTSTSSSDGVAGAVVTAVNGSSLGVTASRIGYGAVALVNDTVGAAGNVPISESVGNPDFTALGMSGGRDPAPDLTISVTHERDLTQRDPAAAYTVTVTNTSGDPTSGGVTVVDTLPTGLSTVSASGEGWVCDATPSCVRTDPLAAQSSWPPITVTVKVAHDAPSDVVNEVSVSGGGDIDPGNNEATDPTHVAPFSCPDGRTTADTEDRLCSVWLTATTVTCESNPVRIGVGTTCTAVVRNQSASGGTVPTGTVELAGDGGGGTFGAPSCTLQTDGADSRCSVVYTPGKGSGTSREISASYDGDTGHALSQGSFTLGVRKRATATSVRCRPDPVVRGRSTVCRATVADVSPGQSYSPTGTVRWSADPTYGTFERSSCTLGNVDGERLCRVTFAARRKAHGNLVVRARYSGDASHAASSARKRLTVS